MCPALNYTLSSLNTSLAVYGTYVHIVCDQGYKFADNNISKVVICEEGGLWNDTVEGKCIGKFSKITHPSCV